MPTLLWSSSERTISLRLPGPGANLSDSVVLEPAAPSPEPRPMAATSSIALDEPQREGTPRAGRPEWKTGGYVALAAAAAFAGGGLVAWRVREDHVAVFNDDG